MNTFLAGMLTSACLVAALCFMRYFRLTRDRFFAFFALAFIAMTVNWIGIATIDPALESRHYIFLVRLLAFALIVLGILDKNRRGSRS